LLCNELFHCLLLFLDNLNLVAKEVDIVTESLTESLDSLVGFDLSHVIFEIISVLADSCFKSIGLLLDNFGKEG